MSYREGRPNPAKVGLELQLKRRILDLPATSYPALNAYCLAHGLMLPRGILRFIGWLRSIRVPGETAYDRWSVLMTMGGSLKHQERMLKMNEDFIIQLGAHLLTGGFDQDELNKLDHALKILEQRASESR